MKATAGMVAAGLLAIAATTVTPTATASAESAAIALVTASAANPPTGDQAVVDRLTSRGHTVTLVDDDAIDDLVAADYGLVAVSGSVSPPKVGDTLTLAPVPVVAWEHQLYDDLGLTTGANKGTTPTTSTIDIVDTSHPIAGSLSGTVDVTQLGRRHNWGIPSDAATVIATESRAPNRPVVFAYESGASMAEGTAPARRVGLYIDPAAPTVWTDDAGTLFDATVDWALGEASEPDNRPPVVDAGPSPLVVDDASVVLTGSVSDDGVSGPVTTSWTGPAGVQFADASDPSTTIVLPAPGTFVLTLNADDGEYAVADDITIEFDDSTEGPTGEVDVLWITASSRPTYGEQPGVDRLESLGMNVEVANDNTVSPTDADGMELIVITSTVQPAAIDPAFADVDVPIMTWEPLLFDELGLVDSGSDLGQTGQTKQIHVADAGHELAAGVSGETEVLSSRKPISWGVPLASAEVIATTTAGSDRASLFAYDTGALTARGPAPARRLAFFLSYSGPRHLSDDGWSLWDAAVDWAVGDPLPAGTAPVARFEPSTVAGEAPLDVTFDASNSSDVDDDITAYEWDFGDGATGSGPTVEHTFDLAGTYDVTLTVSDATGRSDTASTEIHARSEWPLPDHPFRVRLDVGPFADDRDDATVVSRFDATALFQQIGAPHATFDPATLRVVETDAAGNVIDDATVFQFDRDAGFEPTGAASGDLVVLLTGTTGAGETRHFDIYFDTAGGDHAAPVAAAAATASVVTATSGVSDEGLDSIRIDTPTAAWWFDRNGGGFSSLVDGDGNDWISFNDLAGSSGAFRGVPNLTHPEGYFHPGSASTTTRILSNGPARVTIESTSVGGGYTTKWHVYPTFAELEVVRAGGPFWFLYEGTPGGTLDVSSDRVTLADGTTLAASDQFTADIDADDTGAEWIMFGDPVLDRSIFLAHLEDDGVVDSYRPLEGEMTVFGFGRGGNVTPRLGDLPATFRVGLVETADDTTGPPAVRSVLTPPAVSLGDVDQLTPGDLPPAAIATGSPRAGDPPLAVAFDGSGSSDDGTITAYRWDFGDGASATGATATHTYEDTGTYVATLTVIDDAGHTDTDDVVVSVGAPALDRVTDGLVALYEFGGDDERVDDTSGVEPALDLVVADPANVSRLDGGGLSVDGPTTISSDGAATKINESVTASGEITLEAWVRTSDVDQNGPARLASISASPQERNVMVGQGNFATSGDRIEARFNTSSTDANGRPALLSPVGSFDDALTHVVYTRSANGATAIHIDGSLASAADLPGNLGTWDTTMPLTLANEVDGSRPWLGELHLVAFYDRALTPSEICTNLGAGPGTGIGGANLAPSACLTATGSGAEAPAVISFDASTSRDLDGAIVEYRWDFGDGTTATTTAGTVSHQYLEPGDYTVTLTTIDDLGAAGTASITVTVLPTSSGSRVKFTHIASPDPRLPTPPLHDGGADDEQQTASLVADLDGDGDDDIVIAGRKPPGAGMVWYEFVDLDTGWVPHVLDSEVLRIEAGGAVHDVDGDGDTDIVFGRDGTGAEIWWWENPSDSVEPSSTEWDRHVIKSGGDDKHHDMEFGDVDGDGTDELVFWNQRPANRLVVAEIPADPTTPWPTTEVFSNGAVESEGVAIADVDGDGIDDVVGAGLWFARQPDGSFEPHEIDADYAFSRTAVGQLIPGGRPEVVIDSGDAIGPLNWYEWDSNTDAWIRHELLQVSTYGHSLRLGDIDQDGNLDIFSAEMTSPFDTVVLANPQSATRIFFGDGAGGFALQTVAIGTDHHESRLADVDADGDLDIVGKRYNIDVPGIDVWLNDGIDPFGRWERTALDDPAPWTPLFVFDADIDGDGDRDIVTGGWWYEQPTDAAGDWVRHTIGDPLANVAAVADLDGDGDADVIGSHWKLRNEGPNGEFSWGRNDGDGNFTVFPVGDTGDGPFLQGAELATLTDGGPLELVLSWNTGAAGTNTIVVPSNLAAVPSQAPWPMRELSEWSEGEQIVAHDIDTDGDLDLMTGSNWLRNDDDTWVPVEIFELGSGLPDRIVFGDVDGDGDDDVVIGNGHDPNGELSWYERPDDPEADWEQHLVANLTNPQSVDVADLDDDGDVDIVVGEHDMDDLARSRLLIYENLGAGAGWSAHPVHTGDEHHDGAHLVDLDGDGDLDIASIGFIQGRVVVYVNGS